MSLANDMKQIVQPAGKPERTTWETFLHKLWSSVEVGPDCDDCRYLKETPDMYGTGDSPSDFECRANRAADCVRLWEDTCDAGAIAERIFNIAAGGEPPRHTLDSVARNNDGLNGEDMS